jgi:hypothetical protein
VLSHLFDPSVTGDRYGRRSSHIDGAWSILTGIAANASIETGEMIHVEHSLAESGISRPQKQW